MKSAFHRYTQVNTIAVDWKEGATAFKDPIYRAVYYIRAIINLRAVGQAVSTFVQSNEIDPSLITCVGHSLGIEIFILDYFDLFLKVIKKIFFDLCRTESELSEYVPFMHI